MRVVFGTKPKLLVQVAGTAHTVQELMVGMVDRGRGPKLAVADTC